MQFFLFRTHDRTPRKNKKEKKKNRTAHAARAKRRPRAKPEIWNKDRLGEWQKKTSWHRVQVAETIGADLQQGVRVYVEGWLVNRAWVDRENRKHHYTEVAAKDVRFLEALPAKEIGVLQPPQ